MKPFDLGNIPGPHARQPVLTEGPEPGNAAGAIILLHGRGAGAQDIFGLGRILTERLKRKDLILAAPHAFGASWYPNRFMEPIETNQPWLDSARAAVHLLIEVLTGEAALPASRVFLVGFSQGACLATDVVAGHPRRYGGVLAFSGGLIGPAGTTFDYPGDLDGTPVFLGCSDVDPHIPHERVHETAQVLTALNGNVEQRTYPGMGHTINEDELGAAVELIATALSSSSGE